MRILIIHSRPINLAGTGGFRIFLHAITAQFKALGMDVLIYGGDKSATTVTYSGTLHDFKIFTGPIVQPSFWPSSKKLKTVASFCKEQGVTLIHAQGVYTPGFMVRRIFKLTGIPYVLTSHSDLHPGNSNRQKRFSIQSRCEKILRDAAAITHLSPSMEAAAQRIFDVSAKSSLIYNGVNLEEWQPTENQTELNFMLALGRVEREKGPLVLIKMFAAMLRKGVSTSLVIAGTGSAEKECHDLCAELGLNVVMGNVDFDALPEKTVIFTGFVQGEQKQQLLARCKCFLFATQPDLAEEAFGLVQLEAMAAAKPLIASDINIVRHLVADKGMQAVIVPANDIEAWSAAACIMLSDADKRKRMGAANQTLAYEFNWQNVAEQYQNVYQAASKN